MSICAVDPYSNKVTIPESILSLSKLEDTLEETDNPELVIQRPALMLTSCISDPGTCTTRPCETHYLRLINSRDTLLISATRVEDGKWIAHSCQRNPSIEHLALLFQTNRPLDTINKQRSE